MTEPVERYSVWFMPRRAAQSTRRKAYRRQAIRHPTYDEAMRAAAHAYWTGLVELTDGSIEKISVISLVYRQNVYRHLKRLGIPFGRQREQLRHS